jgi:hypothetical protein
MLTLPIFEVGSRTYVAARSGSPGRRARRAMAGLHTDDHVALLAIGEKNFENFRERS